jgi:hypothetical protein
MNGVRRFFAATNVVVPSPSPPTPPSPPPPPDTRDLASPTNRPPLQTSFISGGKQIYPLAGSPSSSPTQSLSLHSPTSPGVAPVALFIKKNNPTSPKGNADFKTLPSPPPIPSQSYTYPWKPVTEQSPTSSTGSTLPAQNNGVQSFSTPSCLVDAIKPSNSTTKLTTENVWNYTSILVNPRDDLLMSLLASEAAVDSSGFQILSSEEVDDLKRVR